MRDLQRDPLRIGMLAPIAWRVPPREYGPWERVVAILTAGLVARGVDVTLFATAANRALMIESAVAPRPYAEEPPLDAKVWECLHIAHAFELAAEFDLIHNHFDFLPLSYSGLVRTPVLTTIHGFSSERILPVYEHYNANTYYVAISDADRHPHLDYAATIYHGIPVEEFTFRRIPDDYLLFFGRIHPDKGAAEAIAVAHQAGRRLLLAGVIHDHDYFTHAIAPHLDGDRVAFLGVADPAQRDTLLGGAVALLHLVDFDEPFGLSMVEAMACGTPVIAYERGSIPEVIDDGETGFIVQGIAAAVAAVARVATLDRARIRQRATARFSQDRMVEEYLRVYATILREHGRPQRR